MFLPQKAVPSPLDCEEKIGKAICNTFFYVLATCLYILSVTLCEKTHPYVQRHAHTFTTENDLHTLNFGSKASLNPSPARLKASVARSIAKPGNPATHIFVAM